LIRRLMIVNVLLLALLVYLCSQFRQKYLLAKARENALLAMHFPPSEITPPTPLSKVPALDATAYQDAVARNLFSKDRNPIPIPDPPPPPPAPPPVPAFPVARGVMLWDGVPPTIVLATAKGSRDERSYHPGEKFGEWTIVSVDHEYLTLEWSGKQFKKRLDELMDHTPLVAEAAPASTATAAGSTAPPAASKSGVTSLSETKNGMGAEVSGVRACVAGDDQPAGTVVDGYKKVVSRTPFSSICRWEPVQ
jgi:hypothetical protein